MGAVTVAGSAANLQAVIADLQAAHAAASVQIVTLEDQRKILAAQINLAQRALRLIQTADQATERNAPRFCTYPECRCPFDAPADPGWCAQGRPRPPATPAKPNAH